MGSGTWTTSAYNACLSSRGFDDAATLSYASVQDAFTARRIDPDLNPKNVVRECCDSDEHPNTLPIIIGLDVTGSMGVYAQQCLASLNDIITSLYQNFNDVQIMTMGIGDLYCDKAPLQVTQFESDERIADQLFKIWIESGGGGNNWESYSLAWYFALHATKLDCHKRGRKGVIITIGDEQANPYLAINTVKHVMGETAIGDEDVDTKALYEQACEKFDIYHIAIKEGNYYYLYGNEVDKSWSKILGDHYSAINAKELPNEIVRIVSAASTSSTLSSNTTISADENGIYW